MKLSKPFSRRFGTFNRTYQYWWLFHFRNAWCSLMVFCWFFFFIFLTFFVANINVGIFSLLWRLNWVPDHITLSLLLNEQCVNKMDSFTVSSKRKNPFFFYLELSNFVKSSFFTSKFSDRRINRHLLQIREIKKNSFRARHGTLKKYRRAIETGKREREKKTIEK